MLLRVNSDTANVNDEWINALHNLMFMGDAVSCRNIPTKELRGYQTLIDMSKPVLTVADRKLGYKFMAAEAAWIMSGDNRVSTIEPYSKHIAKFSDNKQFFFGSYGPKVIDQIGYICETLSNDRFSRQAYMNIWREQPRSTKDVPCTIGLQFMIRDGKLHCFDTMRSSDIWLGWPYDVFNMSMISLGICLLLRDRYGIHVELGNLTLTAASQHLYESNMNDATNTLKHDNDKICNQYITKDYACYEDLIGSLKCISNMDKDMAFSHLIK